MRKVRGQNIEEEINLVKAQVGSDQDLADYNQLRSSSGVPDSVRTKRKLR